MQNGQDHLVVRRHTRLECSLPGLLRVGDAHSAQIVFSRAVVDGDGAVPACVVDCSEGGVGLNTAVYLPKGADLRLLVSLPGPRGAIEHELHLRVRRSSMVSRAPSYYLGTSVIDRSGTAASLGELLRWAASESAKEGAA